MAQHVSKSRYPTMSPEMQERIGILDQMSDQDSQAYLSGKPPIYSDIDYILRTDPEILRMREEEKAARQKASKDDLIYNILQRLREQNQGPVTQSNSLEPLNLLQKGNR